MTRGWIITAVAGVMVTVADVLVSVFWPYSVSTVQVVLHVAVAASWIAAGLVAWARHPELRIGPLMTAVGFAWELQDPWWTSAFPSTVAYVLQGLSIAVGLHAILAFPSGRLESRIERVVVGGVYATLLLGNLAITLVNDPVRQGCAECGRNLLLIDFRPSLEDAFANVQAFCGVVLGVLSVTLLARRWRFATAPGRAVLGPVVWAAIVSGTTTVIRVCVEAIGTAPSWLYWLSAATAALFPIAFLIGLVGARLRRGAMTSLMVELAELPPPQRVRDALARALRDPSLRLVFWVGDRYFDPDGDPTELDPHRATTVLEYGGERFAALEHDPFLYEDRELLEAVGAAARLAVENSRLQAQLRAQLAEVRASRARIVAAGDAERRRLERDLHDGAQQRLLGIRLALKLARSRVGHDDAEVQELLTEADTELMTGLDELRSLARGIHPAVLTDEGLAAALASLARRATVPVEISSVPEERLAAPVEAAAYFVASEALANVAKHAHASSVTITVTRANGWVSLEVADDGVGGADVSRGSGLSGLRDRVEALDGRLEITSRAAAGTMLRAEFPCA
jgi:signal transduction histidine kinase